MLCQLSVGINYKVGHVFFCIQVKTWESLVSYSYMFHIVYKTKPDYSHLTAYPIDDYFI